MGSSRLVSHSLGIDMIEFKKAKAFYKRHHDQFASIFSPAELNYIKKGKKPEQEMAVLLAAKEAVFKSFGPLAGVPGFDDVRIIFGKRKKLSFRLPRTAKVRPSGDFLLSIEKTKNYVVATCHGKNLRCVGI